ncbi:FCD domain-containing protein, partial [Staphylococcus epidermidis]|nr:FCD domain-containing protein [Staphylococcus epidermidis]
REVFRTLIKEGLLHHEANRGVSVATRRLRTSTSTACRLIECRGLEKAWPLHPAHKRMRQAVDEALAAREQGHWHTVGSANMCFHAAIVALSDSDRLSTMFEHLAAELRLAFGWTTQYLRPLCGPQRPAAAAVHGGPHQENGAGAIWSCPSAWFLAVYMCQVRSRYQITAPIRCMHQSLAPIWLNNFKSLLQQSKN